MRNRSRSRSPTEGVKLHVKKLPVTFSQEALKQAFMPFGNIQEVKIIRKGSNGQPLRECVYGFVVMNTQQGAEVAMQSLNAHGWSVSYAKETLQKKQVTQVREEMPNPQSFLHNAQATNIMLLNNANPRPGAPMDRGMLERLLSEHQPNAFNIVSVPEQFKNFFLVREVWIGNITPATDKQALYDAFKKYGEIEGIEMFSSKGFAFIKYRKVLAATLACEKADGTVVDGRPVKVAFADPTRRIDIVGDSSILENPDFNPIDDEHFKNLFLGYSPGTFVPPEAKLREVFSRYGGVKRISIRQGTPTCRPYAFVDFEKGEQASEARQKLYIEDSYGIKRGELGDPALEISFKNTNNIVSRNGLKNGVRFQDRTPKDQASGVAKKLLEQPPALINLLKFQSMLTPQAGPFPMGFNYMGLQMTPGAQQSQSQPAPPEPSPQLETSESKDPQIGNVIWSGFMTRNKTNRVGIDATLVEGTSECFPPSLYHINITHRVHISDVSKFQQIAKVTFEASNNTQENAFQEYIRYFSEKERAGYVPMKEKVLYICPPIESVKKIHSELQDNFLLGVFVDPTKKAEKKPPEESKQFQEILELLRNTQNAQNFQNFQNPQSMRQSQDPRLARINM